MSECCEQLAGLGIGLIGVHGIRAAERTKQKIPSVGTAKDPLLGDPNWVASRILGAGEAYGLQFSSTGGLLVEVDADTPDEIEVAREFFEVLGIEYKGPSVTTPGVKRDDDSHHHWDGGHYYIVLDSPHGLSAASKQYKGSSGAHVDIAIGNKYFLGPQSLRSEGKYEFTGIVYEASTGTDQGS